MGQERRGSFTSPFWWRPLLADVTGTRQAYEACVCRDRQGRGRIPVSTSTTIPSHSHVKSTRGDTVTCDTLSVVNPPCLSLGIGRDDANFGGFVSSCGWVVASPLGRRGPQVQAPWHHGAMGPSTSWDQWPRPVTRAVVETQECTQIGQNGPSTPFWGVCVHCCDTSFATRAASGGTSAPTAMVCWRRPLGGRLPFDREDRLCVSGAAARLASSPRRQPTQTPEEPIHG